MEQLETLGTLTLRQDGAACKLGQDSILLSEFATLRRNDRVFDLGCGIGTLLLLLFAREPQISAVGIELQPGEVKRANENLIRNSLCDRAEIRCGDLRQTADLPAPGCWDLVLSNPPYFLPAAGKPAKSSARAQARAEQSCSILELCQAAARLLRPGGRFALVFRPERLAELFAALAAAGLAPKRLRCVQHTAAHPPSAILLESVRLGRPGLSFLSPIVISERMKKPAVSAGQEA